MVLQQKMLAHRHLLSRVPVTAACRPQRYIAKAKEGGGDVTRQESFPAPQPAEEASQQQQQQQQQDQLPGYDPNAAAGFMPLPGEKPFWWVEKFEERRRRLAEEQAAATTTTTSSSSSSSTTSSNDTSSDSAAKLPGPSIVRKAAMQLLQLAVVNAALILWPASLYPGGLAVKQVWLCYWCYMLFFAGGSVYRLLKFGALAARKKDKQTKTWWTTVSWVLFVITVPFLHWSPVVGFIKRQQAVLARAAGGANSYGYLTVYDIVGFVMLVGAICLNWWSAQHLGKAYDRVVQPDVLVTAGPYAVVQHPIYSSYMLLFVGYSMTLHSAPTALLALVVCLIYYWSRTKLEREVLQQAFGKQYEEYTKRTKLFIPLLL